MLSVGLHSITNQGVACSNHAGCTSKIKVAGLGSCRFFITPTLRLQRENAVDEIVIAAVVAQASQAWVDFEPAEEFVVIGVGFFQPCECVIS